MIGCAFITQSAVRNNYTRQGQSVGDGARRAVTNDVPAAAGNELLSYQYGKWCTNGAADESHLDPTTFNSQQRRVETGPSWTWLRPKTLHSNGQQFAIKVQNTATRNHTLFFTSHFRGSFQ